MKSGTRLEQSRIFGIEAENQPHTKYIKAAEDVVRNKAFDFRLLTFDYSVLFQQFVVDNAHKFASLDRHFHLVFEVVIALIHKELQAVVLLFEVLQQNLLRLAVGLFHIIYPELAEITRYNPPRTLRIGQLRRIAFGLLERIEQTAVRLFDRRTEVFLDAFLLYHNVRARNEGIDE